MLRIVPVIIIFLFGVSPVFATMARVIAVFDGDSLNVDIKGQRIRIKLYGIDAPERGQNGNTSARRFLRHLALDRTVALRDMGQDIFGQTIAILTPEGQEISINARIVANGYAWVNPVECKITDCDQMKQMESQAKRLKLGIWSGYNPLPPWEFRKQNQK